MIPAVDPTTAATLAVQNMVQLCKDLRLPVTYKVGNLDASEVVWRASGVRARADEQARHSAPQCRREASHLLAPGAPSVLARSTGVLRGVHWHI